MTARIGDLAQATRVLAAVQRSQDRVREGQLAVATGRAVRSFAELSSQAGQLLRAGHESTTLTSLAEQAMQVVDRLNAMDGALRAIGGVADRMRSLLVNRLDGATGGSVALAEEARGALEEIASQLNTRVDDRYLFAGSRTDMEPVSLPTSLSTVADPDLYYRGDGVELSVRVGNSRELPYGITAAEPGFARLIAGLGEAASADLAGDRNGLETALVGLTSAIGSIAELRGQVGSRAQQLLTIADEHKATASLLDDTVARLEKTDIPTAMADLATHEATLQASYLTVSRLAGLSLADYLR